MECLFCKIVAGSIPAEKIYEDDKFVAIMDINPVSKGHLLLIPRKHYVSLGDATEDDLQAMAPVIRKVSNGLVHALDATGFNIVQNNGPDAGQLIFHSHIHIIPRFPADGIHIGVNTLRYDDGEMSRYGSRIRNVFASL